MKWDNVVSYQRDVFENVGSVTEPERIYLSILLLGLVNVGFSDNVFTGDCTLLCGYRWFHG